MKKDGPGYSFLKKSRLKETKKEITLKPGDHQYTKFWKVELEPTYV